MNAFSGPGFWAQFGVTIVAASGVAYAASRWLSKKWLEHLFAERLEAFKHAKNREIEELRGEINALLDRTVKLHAKEFEVLPLAWDKMSVAYGAIRLVANRGQQYPDVTWMEPAPLNALMDELKLEKHVADEIRKMARGTDRQTALERVLDRHRLSQAHDFAANIRNYLVQNGIFMQPELKVRFLSLMDIVWGAINERLFDRQFPEAGKTDRWVKADQLAGEGFALYQEVEAAIQTRLWDRKLLPDGSAPGD